MAAAAAQPDALPQELIRTKRDGGTLSAEQVQAFVKGLAAGDGDAARWGDSQVAAMAMAVVLRGMDRAETVALTRAMTHSGQVLDWSGAGLPGPVLDKHSTGGVGDKLSLMLAPLVAACGGLVPMVSGRGLGHTGGTLDKLEALPGYRVDVDRAGLLAVLRRAGCAIVGASAQLAPADRRLYGIRDLTATVESVPRITASILSKKLAAGLQGLVLDVKVGSGAFTPSLPAALELAHCLVDTACAAGLPTRALVTDMSQVLGRNAGNALEVAEALAFLKGESGCPRQRALTLRLAAELMHLGGLAASVEQATDHAERALARGEAAERFAQMVAALGGLTDVLSSPGLPTAPVVHPVLAPASCHETPWLAALDVRALGLVVVALGGGRSRPGEPIDARVGLSAVASLGQRLQPGEPVCWVHAADATSAEAAAARVLAATRWSAQPLEPPPLVHDRVAGPPRT